MDIKTETGKQGQLSLEASQVAIHHTMGALIAEYRQREKRRSAWSLLIIPLYLFMIGLLIFLIWTVIDNLDAYLQFLSSSFINILTSICLVLFLLFAYGFLLTGIIPLIFYRNRHPSILHCTKGLLYRRGGRTIAMPWDDIESVTESIWALPDNTENQFYTCTLRLHNKKYAFSRDIEHARILGRTIEREITQRRITASWQRIKKGEQLQFGQLSISQEGMAKGSQLVPWDQISQVHIFAGIIAIAKDGVPQKWPLVRVAHIPNFFLFVALVHQLVNGRVSYQPLEFVFKDYFVELMRLPFRKKAQ